MTSKSVTLQVEALQKDYGWQPMTALVHLAKMNGHQLGLCRLTASGSGLGYMARCGVPSCGASVWERPDLQGGHGAGPVVLCTGQVPAAPSLPERVAAAVAADFPGIPHRHAAITAEVIRYLSSGEGNSFIARWTAEHIAQP